MRSLSPRYPLLALLYVAQALPLGFFVIAMPAILRARGVGLERIGLLAALALPFLLKFLWAPLVDRYGRGDGHYRSWLIPLQVGAVLSVAWIATLDPVADGTALLIAGGLFMFLAATQDIATDGLAVRLLDRSQRGLGNGIQVGGYYLGQILGGGVVLVLVDRFGWGVALAAMAVVLALPLPLVLALREPAAPLRDRAAIGIKTIAAFFRRPAILPWVGVLLLWRAGETMATWMVNPMLVDRGFSLEAIGVLLGMLGSAGALAGALLGGQLATRLGRHRALVTSGAILGVCLFALIVPALGRGGLAAIQVVVVIVSFAGGAATAALYTAAMDASDAATAGTDFTVQQSLAAIGPLLAASTSGLSAAQFGYAGHFALAGVVQLGALALIASSAGLRRGVEERAGVRE